MKRTPFTAWELRTGPAGPTVCQARRRKLGMATNEDDTLILKSVKCHLPKGQTNEGSDNLAKIKGSP